MSALAALADLVFPRRCVGCGSFLGVLCAQCLPAGSPQRATDDVWAAAGYAGEVRAALLAYKERGRRDLAGPLGELLARSIRAAQSAGRDPPPGVLLVPVPSARSAALARGGDHVLRLARRAGPRCGLRTAPALRLIRPVQDSAGLGVSAREANLAGAFAARPASDARWSALVVDDIVTTGATLREAARALRAAGWPVVGAAVVAATPRRSGGGSKPLALHRRTV